MKHVIDVATWSRRGNYEFFRDFDNSWYSVTTEIGCGRAFDECRNGGGSFFLRYLYAVVRAANEVEAMRYRKTPTGEIVLYDKLDIITPIASGDNFVTVRIPYVEDYDEFSREAARIISGIKPGDNPYRVEENMTATGDHDVVHLSAVPKIYFTAMSFTAYKAGNACEHPLSVMGKARRSADGRMTMPYAVYVDHMFVDGAHLADFFSRIEELLD